VRVDGFIGDTARTVIVGECSEETQKLIDVTQQALYDGISHALSGNRVKDISCAVQNRVEANGFSIVREFVGHGVGRTVHEEPQIPNFVSAGETPELRPGMTLAIEPMVNVGGMKVKFLSDGWTVVTRDGRSSAHFEHTIAVTEGEPEILTCLELKPSASAVA
jgi:methionyl aminopeptidase